METGVFLGMQSASEGNLRFSRHLDGNDGRKGQQNSPVKSKLASC